MDYRYRPLAVDRREIRLLDVLPTHRVSRVPRSFEALSIRRAPLSCRIRHASFNDDPPPQYETVSYVWGNPDPCKHILVNGEKLRIPSNTNLALRRLASPDQYRTLWIDAVCINQSDLTERSQQVTLMGNIYSNAIQGLVYLGEGSRRARRAFNTIKALMPEVEQIIPPTSNALDALYIGRRWELAKDEIQTPFEEETLRALFGVSWFRRVDPTSAAWMILADFFSGSGRVWVVQEAALTPRNLCIWGSSTMDLDNILTVAIWLYRFHRGHISHGLHGTPGLYNASNMCAARIDCERYGGTNIYNVLAQARYLQASDPRDKVYGTLGITHEQARGIDSGLLAPDYTKPVREVLLDATRQCILASSDFGLDILHYVSHRSEADLQADGYPSWTFRIDRPWDADIDPSVLPDHPDSRAGALAASKPVDKDLLGSWVCRTFCRSEVRSWT